MILLEFNWAISNTKSTDLLALMSPSLPDIFGPLIIIVCYEMPVAVSDTSQLNFPSHS